MGEGCSGSLMETGCLHGEVLLCQDDCTLMVQVHRAAVNCLSDWMCLLHGPSPRPSVFDCFHPLPGHKVPSVSHSLYCWGQGFEALTCLSPSGVLIDPCAEPGTIRPGHPLCSPLALIYLLGHRSHSVRICAVNKKRKGAPYLY